MLFETCSSLWPPPLLSLVVRPQRAQRMSTFYTILGLLLVSVAFLLGTMAEEKRRTTSGSQVETQGAGLGGAACGLGIAGGL